MECVKADPATGIRGETFIVGYPLHILTSTKVNERTLMAVLKAWWEHHAELQTIHPLFKQFTKESSGDHQFYDSLSYRLVEVLPRRWRVDGQA